VKSLTTVLIANLRFLTCVSSKGTELQKQRKYILIWRYLIVMQVVMVRIVVELIVHVTALVLVAPEINNLFQN